MSDVILHGVLNMPIDIWGDDYLDKVQRHSRYVEASKLIIIQQENLEDLGKCLIAAEKDRDDYLKEAERLVYLNDELNSKLRTAEQERDQYKAELVECSRLIEQMQVSEHQKHLELESLRAKIKEAQEQKPYGYILEHSDGVEFYHMEVAANFNCTDRIGCSVSPIYLNPVIPD